MHPHSKIEKMAQVNPKHQWNPKIEDMLLS